MRASVPTPTLETADNEPLDPGRKRGELFAFFLKALAGPGSSLASPRGA